MSIKILDCTLRDGGYNNNWTFGRKAKTRVPRFLAQAGVEFIEMGFLQKGGFSRRQSLFADMRDADEFIPKAELGAKTFVMVDFKSRYPISEIPQKSEVKTDGIRVVFYPSDRKAAFEYIAAIKEKGYIVAANPMQAHLYDDAGRAELASLANKAKPHIFAIVDSFGCMSPAEVEDIGRQFDRLLSPEIALGFHAHDNLGLALPSALNLINLKLKRELIIDSSLRGMGRGGGNLRTEIIAMWLNQHAGKSYNLDRIFDAIDDYIGVQARKKPWAMDAILGLSGMEKLHQNYAIYLLERKLTSARLALSVFKKIAEISPDAYDEKLIEKLVKAEQANLKIQ